MQQNQLIWGQRGGRSKPSGPVQRKNGPLWFPDQHLKKKKTLNHIHPHDCRGWQINLFSLSINWGWNAGGLGAFAVAAPKLWNESPPPSQVRPAPTLTVFKSRPNTHSFSLVFPDRESGRFGRLLLFYCAFYCSYTLSAFMHLCNVQHFGQLFGRKGNKSDFIWFCEVRRKMRRRGGGGLASAEAWNQPIRRDEDQLTYCWPRGSALWPAWPQQRWWDVVA